MTLLARKKLNNQKEAKPKQELGFSKLELPKETAEVTLSQEKQKLDQETFADSKKELFGPKLISKPPLTPSRTATFKSQDLIKIENILEQDLETVYFKMPPVWQQKFKIQGEKTAAKIEQLLKQTKIKTKKIFKLILDWLKMIPGVNKFFIRQEAKIKTDKIIKLK
jgi:hypothetical protein